MTTRPLGKSFLLKVESTTVPGTYVTVANCRSNSMSLANEAIDVTDKDGMPWRTLLEGGVRSMETTAAGVFTDAATIKQMFVNARNGYIKNFQLVDSLGYIAAGAFQVQSFDKAGEYNKEVTYSFKLASSGTISFTDPA